MPEARDSKTETGSAELLPPKGGVPQPTGTPSRSAGRREVRSGASGSRKARLVEAGAVLGRWLVGLLFVYMGLNKALHPDLFLKLVRQYEMVSNPYLLNVIAASLPWFEVFCGLLLVAGIAVRGAALMLLLMLMAFTPLVLKRALVLAAATATPLCLVKFDCGCGTGEVFACNKLVENCLLMVFCAWLLTGRGHRLCLWFCPFQKRG